MSGMLVRMFKTYRMGEPDEEVVDITVQSNGEVAVDMWPQDTLLCPLVGDDLTFAVVDQLSTIQRLELNGWILRPASSWERAN